VSFFAVGVMAHCTTRKFMRISCFDRRYHDYLTSSTRNIHIVALASTESTVMPTLSLTNTPEATALAEDAVESATSLPSCVVRPALTEGPYFVDAQLNRSDIRTEPSDGSVKEGALLKILFNVSLVGEAACTPLNGAQVDM